ncbi:hypothetical protein BH23PSE1_BH23PSE1_11720 [soil metagenome]
MPLHLPALLRSVPPDLGICQAPASDDEVARFLQIRRRYAGDPGGPRAERDKIRAFRLMKGVRRYIEIGTFDKFNLCYVMAAAAPEAVVVDLDIAPNEPARQRLEAEKPPGQRYHCIIGDSTAPATRQAVLAAAGPEPFDAVFIDANHVAPYAMSDFTLYGEMVGPAGYVFFHDVKWEGGERSKGVADALDVLQRFVPVYQVLAGQPVTHWHRPLTRQPNNWGGIAIIRGTDLHRAAEAG